jgi:outer membrane protein assembly factor BamB
MHRKLAYSYRQTTILLILVLSLLTVAHGEGQGWAQRVYETSGIKGGLVVHLGCGDGKLTALLRVDERYLVHGLDPDRANVAKARMHISSHGLYGAVSVDSFDGKHLPYVDNLVNLLVAEDLGDVPMLEVMRVLAPGGIALVDVKKTVKPWPDNIDEWTHFLHGPDNNAVADDTVVGPPRGVQWLAGPSWTRHHDRDKGTQPGIRTLVSSNGRIYYLVDETTPANLQVPPKWFLVARDAFSGVLLWKKPLQVEAFERRLEWLWRSVIADGDEVYLALETNGPLSALNGATGTVIRHYRGTEGYQEAIKNENSFFILNKLGDLVALRVETGQQLWTWAPPPEEEVVPLTLATSAGKVFIKTDKSICCLSSDDGNILWRFVPEEERRRTKLKWPRAKLIAKDGVALCSYGGKDPQVLNRDRWQYLGSHPRVNEYGGRLAALSAESGKVLWETAYKPGLESYPGDIFVVDGLVWLGPDFVEARDLHTGQVKNGKPVLEGLWTTGHHHRCYPAKATSRYVLTGKRGIEMIDLIGENHSRNNWVRGSCRLGVTPCNGLIYATPHSCGCYMEAKLYGFYALRPAQAQRSGAKHQGSVERIEKGPAYGKVSWKLKARGPNPENWPTYRHDPERSGTVQTKVPCKLTTAWHMAVGGRITSPVIADGKILVSSIDSYRIICLNAESGDVLWDYKAGGRVDSPPTIYHGLMLAGCADGNVYCLRLADGELVWRFMAAPQQLNTVACDRVESLWPVHGSVLVKNGVVYAAAGRSSYLDGGLLIYGLDPVTGKVLHKINVQSEHAGLIPPPPDDEATKMKTTIRQNRTDYKTFLAPDKSDAFAMSGARNDILVADDSSVYLRHLRFDGTLTSRKKRIPHLFSTSGLLDGSENHRSHWVLGTGDFSRTPVAYPWIMNQLAVPYGLMLVFDGATVWGVQRGRSKRTRPGEYLLFAARRPDPADEESSLPDFQTRPSKPGIGYLWTTELSMRPRAMIRAGDVLFCGGMTAEVDARDAYAPRNAVFEGKAGGILRTVSAGTGKILGEVPLESPPVWDGMAAAGGRLYISTVGGKIFCLAEK